MTDEGQAFLRSIQREICVIGITGAMRKGKSYLMNLLWDRNCPSHEAPRNVFELGSMSRGCTKGVWACLAREDKDGKAILLLDFEGMYDPERSNPNFDAQLFLLAVLCSSSFVYNLPEQINTETLEQLAFIANLGDHMEASGDWKVSFPAYFTWVIRDVPPNWLDGKTDNEYMEEKLRFTHLRTKKDKELDEIRESIQDGFPRRSCFTLMVPVDGAENLRRVGDFPFNQLVPRFQHKARELIAHLYQTLEPKKIRDHADVGNVFGSMIVDGPTFLSFVGALVGQLNTSKVFCMENACTQVALARTRDAFTHSKDQFDAQMLARFGGPEPAEVAVLASEAEGFAHRAVQQYDAGAILKTDQSYGKDALKAHLQQVITGFQEQNMAKSRQQLEALLDSWIAELKDNLRRGVIATKEAYEQWKAELVVRVSGLHGQPAGFEMESVLYQAFGSTDTEAALKWKLSEAEQRIQQQDTQNKKVQADLKRIQVQTERQRELMALEMRKLEDEKAAAQIENARKLQESEARIAAKNAEYEANIRRQEEEGRRREAEQTRLYQQQMREAEDKRRRAAEEEDKRHQRKIEELKASNEAKAKAVIVNSTETWKCPGCGKKMVHCAKCGKHHC